VRELGFVRRDRASQSFSRPEAASTMPKPFCRAPSKHSENLLNPMSINRVLSSARAQRSGANAREGSDHGLVADALPIAAAEHDFRHGRRRARLRTQPSLLAIKKAALPTQPWRPSLPPTKCWQLWFAAASVRDGTIGIEPPHGLQVSAFDHRSRRFGAGQREAVVEHNARSPPLQRLLPYRSSRRAIADVSAAARYLISCSPLL
jgi:hypothetical protein